MLPAYVDVCRLAPSSRPPNPVRHCTAPPLPRLEQVLSFLDFFPTSVQRTATATAANMCRSLLLSQSTASSSTVQSAIKEAIPMLVNLLQYSVRAHVPTCAVRAHVHADMQTPRCQPGQAPLCASCPASRRAHGAAVSLLAGCGSGLHLPYT
jgi:hypothetical protein